MAPKITVYVSTITWTDYRECYCDFSTTFFHFTSHIFFYLFLFRRFAVTSISFSFFNLIKRMSHKWNRKSENKTHDGMTKRNSVRNAKAAQSLFSIYVSPPFAHFIHMMMMMIQLWMLFVATPQFIRKTPTQNDQLYTI